MKVFLPYTDLFDRSIKSEYITGGVEKFCKHIYKEFDTTIYEVPFIENKASVKHKREITQEMLHEAYKSGADIILSNFPGSIFSGVEIAKSTIPVLKLNHIFYSYSTPIRQWKKFDEYGHSVYFVSPHQENRYRKLAKKYNEIMIEPSGYIFPSFIDELPAISEPSYDVVTIGRTNSQKDPFLLYRLAKNTDISYRIYTSYAHDDDVYNSKYERHTAFWNKPHSEIMEGLSRAKVYLSTCPHETWGVTALESLSYGIPLILVTDSTNTHASEVIPPTTKYYRKIRKSSQSDFLQYIEELSLLDRSEIRERTYKKHNKDAWKYYLQTEMEQTIEKFYKKRNVIQV